MSEKHELIEAECDADTDTAPTIVQMCSWLGVSRSGFYQWRSCPESALAQRRVELKLLITRAFEDSDGTYRYRRVGAQLTCWGVAAGLELVRDLMRSWAWWRASLGRGDRRRPSRAALDRSPTW